MRPGHTPRSYQAPRDREQQKAYENQPRHDMNASLHASGNRDEAWLLVRPRKIGLGAPWCGPAPIAERTPGGLGVDPSLDRAAVTVPATTLERDGVCMIEVESFERAADADSALGSEVRSQPSTIVRVTGEHVDSKCYLGAMKPGQSPVHRACAALCLAGGIPAGVVTAGAEGGAGQARLYIVTGKLPKNGAGLVGEQVLARGVLERFGAIHILVVDDWGVERR